MRKPARIALIAVLLCATVAALVLLASGRGERETLAAYQAHLRAQGEKLTLEELGFPRHPIKDSALNRLLAGTFQLGQAEFQPGQLKLMEFVVPGRVQVCWDTNTIGPAGNWGTKVEPPTWAEFLEQMAQRKSALEEIRVALQDPPPYWLWDTSAYPDLPSSPFVELRKAAQWLSGDTVAALHAGELARAHADLHALTQLIQLHREDFLHISQMIRVGIGGLGLNVTWEALQARGWSEAQLAALQHDWEAVDFLAAAETGLTGSRALVMKGFESARTEDGESPYLNNSSARENVLGSLIVGPYYRAHMAADEQLALEQFQNSLVAVRRLRLGQAWPPVAKQLDAQFAEFQAILEHPLKKYRHLLSGIAIPNMAKVSKGAIRNETLRRLTVTAIALERHLLRHGRYPPALAQLTPEVLSVAPLDPMSGQAMRYRLNADGTYTLYSVGEDGRDDSGDAQPLSGTNRFELWETRDVVWPGRAE